MNKAGKPVNARQKLRSVYSSIGHDSARKHVAGTARYVDDIP
jgi:xanthine dehydrogenase molybdopterin-binding subunit B